MASTPWLPTLPGDPDNVLLISNGDLRCCSEPEWRHPTDPEDDAAGA